MKTRLILLLAVMALTFLLSGVALATGFPPGFGATSDDATPERIAGHEVLGVQNSDNLKCYSGPGPMVILAASSQSADILLSEDGPDFDAIKRALNDEGYSDETGIVLSGPGITKQMVENQRLRWNRIQEERGCIQFGGPHDLEEDQVSGGPAQSYAQINPNLQPGYSKVVDSEVGPYTNHNAQSVILEAPQIGDNQSNFSAFLNNGFANESPLGSLLQNGLLFNGEEGSVVWTDEAHGLSPVPYAMDYYVGHNYWFTISHTNSLWWLCASDWSASTNNYQCRSSQSTGGTALWGGDNTSVWVENQNSSWDWYEGFTNPVIAYQARNYVNGSMGYWNTELQETTWCGADVDDPTGSSGAISGTLVHNGRAEFLLERVPSLCP